MLPTEPIREEHRGLLPHIEQLREAADALGADPDADHARIDDALRFLADHLYPHAHAEEAVLYPAVARTMGAPLATATMSRDHVEVVALTERLFGLRGRWAAGEAGIEAELRAVLYGLHAIVSLHFAKEEEVYLPLLDRAYTSSEFAALYERMEEAAQQRPAPIPA